jgi:hypothetical protein
MTRRVARPVAALRSNALQARHRPAIWFQQLAQVELEQSGHVRKSLAPADPSRSLSSPQRSQKALASPTRSALALVDRTSAERFIDDTGRSRPRHASGRTGDGSRTSRSVRAVTERLG